jgi:hypothetical protein
LKACDKASDKTAHDNQTTLNSCKTTLYAMISFASVLAITLLLASSAVSEKFEGDEITLLDNGAMVRTRYKVDSADHLIHLHLEEQISALTCAEDHVLINTSGNFQTFDAEWRNGSTLISLFNSLPFRLPHTCPPHLS